MKCPCGEPVSFQRLLQTRKATWCCERCGLRLSLPAAQHVASILLLIPVCCLILTASVAAALISGVLAFCALLAVRATDLEPEFPPCRNCGYDIRGSSGRCPECGERAPP